MAENTKNIVVLVSGGGTNLQALIDSQNRGDIKGGRITCVISSKEGAYALERAKNAGIKTRVLARKDYSDIAEYSKAMKDAQEAAEILEGCDDSNVTPEQWKRILKLRMRMQN